MNSKKFELVKSMNAIVVSLNNEEPYYQRWIHIVPDCATDEDFWDIAADEELFKDAVNCFKDIMKDYLKDGIYIDKNLY